ncbi:hypothetical protein [Psychromonas aquimarina]|uniref:hypothetical protein n=1 Tax=Psychromonas aquimarina TaxID=444919 RepID=UPI00040E72B6|nr:hypothetical protein [Psychromonas aquimarina]
MKIEYLSESNPDYKCLEEYISNGSFGSAAEQWLIDAQTENKLGIENLKSQSAELFSQEETGSEIEHLFSSKIAVPTKYDSLLQYSIVSALMNKIKSSAEILALNNQQVPCFTSLPTGEGNASALKLPGSSKVFLLFDSHLFTFCHLFSKAFSLCLPISVNEDDNVKYSVELAKLKSHIENNNNQCVDRVQDLLHCFCVNKRPVETKAYQAPEDYLPLINVLKDGMQLMIVGHEFGHLCSGHLDKELQFAVINSAIEDDLSDQHTKEYEADFLGALLALQALNSDGRDVVLSYTAVELFYSAMILCARYSRYTLGKKNKHFEEAESAAHPTFINRKHLIRHAIKNVEGIEKYRDAIDILGEFSDQCVDMLWMEIIKKCSSK